MGIVHTQPGDVDHWHIFERLLKQTERKFEPLFSKYEVKMESIRRCCEEFVRPFIKKLDAISMVV